MADFFAHLNYVNTAKFWLIAGTAWQFWTPRASCSAGLPSGPSATSNGPANHESKAKKNARQCRAFFVRVGYFNQCSDARCRQNVSTKSRSLSLPTNSMLPPSLRRKTW